MLPSEDGVRFVVNKEKADKWLHQINEAIGNALDAVNEIYPTDLSSLDSLLLEMKDHYGRLKTTYENIVDNLESSIFGVCPFSV